MFARLTHRHQNALVYATGAAVSVFVAALLTRGGATSFSKPLLAIGAVAGMAILFYLPERTLFIGWLFFAPIVGAAIDVSTSSRALAWSLYIAPAVVMAVLTLARPARAATRLDLIPAAFVVYGFASVLATNGSSSVAKGFFQVVVLGVIVYYFLTLGPGRAIPRHQIVAAVLAAGSLQAILAIVEWLTTWNLWHDTYWQQSSPGSQPRMVGTLANPGVLGMFLGVAIVLAIAVLGSGGPRHLRRLASLALLLGIPGLLLTLTRGPILATTVAAALLLVIAPRTRLLAVGIIAVLAVAVAFLLPTIKSSAIYKDRVSDQVNVRGRLALQTWSFRLASEKPVLGWGYGTFDQVKNANVYNNITSLTVTPTALGDVLANTSHNTYLTVLVELGGVGLALLVLPWGIIALMAVRRLRAPSEDRWLLLGGVAAVLVIMLTAVTLDFRFFSFAEVLPWIVVALLREGAKQGVLARPQAARRPALARAR